MIDAIKASRAGTMTAINARALAVTCVIAPPASADFDLFSS